MKIILTFVFLFTVSKLISQPLLVNIVSDTGGATGILECDSEFSTLTANVTGGLPPYSFLWSNGATTNNINFLTSVNYTVTVTDANSNSTTASYQGPQFLYGYLWYFAPSLNECDGGFIFDPFDYNSQWASASYVPPSICYNQPYNLSINSFPSQCPWDGLSQININTGIHYSGPYTINPIFETLQTPCYSNIAYKIFNQHKLNWQLMTSSLTWIGWPGRAEVRDLQNNLILSKSIGYFQSDLLQYQDSLIINFDSIPSGTYVFHYTEGILNNQFGSPDTFGVHLIDTFTVLSLPEAIITASGSTSICQGSSVILTANIGSGLTYQWKLNGNSIPGAVNSTYSAITGGNYSVVITNICGTSTSNVIAVQIKKCFTFDNYVSNNEVLRTITENEISIFPNPSQKEFNVTVTSHTDQLFSLKVFDHAGRIVELHESIISNEIFTFGNGLSPGFYFVEINSENEKEVFKIVKVE